MEKLLVLLVVPLAALAAPQVGFGDASDQEIAEIRAGSYLETVDDNPQYNFQYKVADDKEQTYIAMDEERAGDTVSGTYSYVDPLGSLIVVTYTAGPMGYQETREVKENFVTIRARPARTQSVNRVAEAEAQRLEAQRLQAQRLEAQRAEAQRLEAQRLEAQRLEAQRLEAQRLEAQRAEAQRLEAQRLEAQRLETQRLEAQRLEAQRIAEAEAAAEAQRIEDERNALLEAQRIEAARLEAEAAAAAANSQIDIVSQIVAQIQPLVSQTVSSAVSGSRFPSGGRPVTRVRVPARIPQPVVQTPASSDLVNVFGQDGDFNVRLNHLGIEY
jgi:hypothetical protein